MTITLTTEQVRRLRLAGQAVLPALPAGADPAGRVARRVCGLQAQDMFAATLGVRVRAGGSTLAEVERARYIERSVIWTWAMRGTLHLLAADDLDWLLSLIGAAEVAASRRRRQQLGLDEETYARGVRALRDRITGHGPSTREELGEALMASQDAGGGPAERPGYPIERHFVFRAALEGIVCMGPDRGPRPTFVLLDEWVGRPLKKVDPEIAAGELARRYLAAYGPATPADLATWSGLPVPLLRAGWRAVEGSLAEVSMSGKSAWLPHERLAEIDTGPDSPAAIRLLPAFDTYLLGYRTRELTVDPAFAARVNGGGGMIRPVILVDGQAAGTWLPNRKGRRINITLDPFTTLAPSVEAGVSAEVADIQRFIT